MGGTAATGVPALTRPDFIGIGAPKAATTWLHNVLAEHPGIYMTPHKDLGFFDYLDPVEHRMAEYERLFDGAGPEQKVGEISVVYLDSPRAPDRIHKLLPGVRLFASLRNPVDQIYSHYWHLKRQNFHIWPVVISELPANLQQAVERFPDQLIRPARYAEHLSRWLALFPRECLHLVVYDDIKAAPEATVRQLFDFIGVDPAYVLQMLDRRETADRHGVAPKGRMADILHCRIYAGLNRYLYHPAKRVLGVETAMRIKDALQVRPVMERLFMQSGYPPLGKDDRAMLVAIVRDDVDRLQTILQRDLSHWLEV
jgi:hypothetical protein